MSDEKFQMWVCQEDKHNKWWTFEVSGNSVTTKYGRIGQNGQSSTKSFKSTWERDAYAHKKLSEKRAKGYEPVTKEQFDLFRLQAEIMGTGNKIEQTMILLEHGGSLFSLSPKAAYDPSLKLAIGVIFRLRDKDGATEPYFLMFQDETIYEVTIQARDYYGRKNGAPKSLKDEPLDKWTVRKSKVTEGHPLFKTVEKLETVLGSTL